MEYKLRDLYKVSNGLSKGGSFFGSGFPFISFSTVFNNFFVPEEINDFVQSTLKEQITYSIKKGDILITRTSETIDELGMSCVALKDYPTATFNGFCKRLRPLTDKVYPHFIGYYLRTPYFRSNFTKVASLITRASLRNEDLLRFSIELPPIYKQKKIAEILYSYDNLIENNNKRIKLLGQMAENLYKEWFVRFRFPGYENEHFIEDIPSSWSYVQLGDIASFDRGISYSSDEINCDDGINLINLKNVQSYGGFRRDGTKQYNGKYKDSQIVVAGDLILGVTDMTQDRRTVGSVALIPLLSGTSVISADLVKVNLKVPNVFFYCMCRYGFYSKYFSQFANGANVLHLKPNVLLNKKILLPIAGLIEAFAEKVQPMIDIVDDLNCQNDLLAKQRDMLLPRLMSGKLEV
jgi:restriction modification system DNA specificity domain protein